MSSRFHVFKISVQQGMFSHSLNIAKVTPIFKYGDKVNVSNYRPISILPAFSKENKKQFGFQRNNSTEHTILQLTRDVTSSLEKGKDTLGVFIDLSKAFGTVNHQILIKKLQYYGIEGTALEWFKSCLSKRKQCISSQDISESFLDIICGVPQELYSDHFFS